VSKGNGSQINIDDYPQLRLWLVFLSTSR